MIRKKRLSGRARWGVTIMAALLFGAFLGSPFPEAWADRMTEAWADRMTEAWIDRMAGTRTVLQGQTGIADFLHNRSEDKTTEAAAEAVEIAAAVEIVEAAEIVEAVEIVSSGPPEEAQPDYVCLNANRGGTADRKERNVLIHLINAEAYGLSYKAKLAVGQVVMNRWTGPYYGDDLLAIMTAPHQFTPIYDGSAYQKNIEPDSIKAANTVLNGTGVADLTDDTYYFVNPDYTEDKTIETQMEFVCEIEGIHFFKPPAK